MYHQADELRTAIDALSVPGRMALLSSFARESSPDELTRVVDEWQQSNDFYRRLAIHMAAVACRTDLLAPQLDDPQVGPTVIVRLAELGAANLVVECLGDLPRVHRDAFYRAIRRLGLTLVADSVIRPMRDRFGDQEAARIVGICSPAVAAEHLPGLVHLIAHTGGSSINHLVRRAPDVVGDALNALVGPWPATTRIQLLAERSGLLAELARVRPGCVFDLLEHCIGANGWPVHGVFARVINALASADAARTAILLAHVPQVCQYVLTRAAARRLVDDGTSQDQYANLLRTLWKSGLAGSRGAARLLKAIPPSRRTEAIGPDLLATVWVDHRVATLLPAGARHDYARRWLHAHAGVGLLSRLPWLGLLPVSDLDEVVELTRRPDPAIRQAAYQTLIDAAFRERTDAAIEWVLPKLSRLTNEQDPVRLAVATALLRSLKDRPMSTSLRVWLGDFIVAVRQARDTSSTSVTTLTNLIESSLNNAVAVDDTAATTWALDQLDELFATATGVLRPSGLSQAAIDAATPLMLSWMKRWPISRRMEQIRCLHTRRRPEIWDVTAHLVRREALSPSNWQAAAIRYYLDDPRHRGERVEEILKAAPSAGYLGCCAVILAGQRTDLLDPYLVASPTPARFVHSDGFFVTSPGLVERWLPRQQVAYVAALTARMFVDKKLPTSWSHAATLTAAARCASDDRLQRYLSAQDVVPVEAALGSLGNAGLPPDEVADRLLREAGTDRARVAMYALSPVLGRLPPARTLALARPFILGEKPAKVTSRKAIIQFADQLRLPDVAVLMAAVLAQPGVHHDVAYFAAAVLSRHLDDPRAQAALRALAASNPFAVSGVLRTASWSLASAGRVALAELVADLLGSDDELARQLARERYGHLAQWAPQGNATLIEQILRSPWDEWRQTATTLGAAASHGVLDGLLAVIGQLAARADAESAAAPNVEADLPSLRRLECLVGTWAAQLLQPAAAIAGMREVCAVLGDLELTRPLAVRALVQSAFRVDQPRVDGDLFAAGADLCEPWLATLVGKDVGRWGSASDPDHLVALATRYCQTPQAGLVTALVAAHRGGWSGEWLEILAHLRHHDDPAIRAVASSIDPSAV